MDALEKARFLSIQDQDFLGDFPDLEARRSGSPATQSKWRTIEWCATYNGV